jgi:arsenate reductase
MKEKVKALAPEKILGMLAQEGRLIKRPIVTDGKKATVGFNESEFAATWG